MRHEPIDDQGPRLASMLEALRLLRRANQHRGRSRDPSLRQSPLVQEPHATEPATGG